MKVNGHYLGGTKDMQLEEIEEWISLHIWDSNRYTKHDLEIYIDADQGIIDIWLDDCDWEEHLMEIMPTKSELKLIDKKGICGHRPSSGRSKCPLNLSKYDWLLHRNVCTKCRECFNSRE